MYSFQCQNFHLKIGPLRKQLILFAENLNQGEAEGNAEISEGTVIKCLLYTKQARKQSISQSITSLFVFN